MRRSPRLVEQDDLVYVGRLELAETAANRLGRADQTRAQRLLRLRRVAPFLVEGPHVAASRSGHAVPPVVREAEDEEGPSRGLGLCFLVGGGAHEGAHHGHIGIARIVRELVKASGEIGVVLGDPGLCRLRETNWKPSAPMPHCPALPMVAMFEQATQRGGCGFWNGLGITLRAGKSKKRP